MLLLLSTSLHYSKIRFCSQCGDAELEGAGLEEGPAEAVPDLVAAVLAAGDDEAVDGVPVDAEHDAVVGAPGDLLRLRLEGLYDHVAARGEAEGVGVRAPGEGVDGRVELREGGAEHACPGRGGAGSR